MSNRRHVRENALLETILEVEAEHGGGEYGAAYTLLIDMIESVAAEDTASTTERLDVFVALLKLVVRHCRAQEGEASDVPSATAALVRLGQLCVTSPRVLIYSARYNWLASLLKRIKHFNQSAAGAGWSLVRTLLRDQVSPSASRALCQLLAAPAPSVPLDFLASEWAGDRLSSYIELDGDCSGFLIAPRAKFGWPERGYTVTVWVYAHSSLNPHCSRAVPYTPYLFGLDDGDVRIEASLVPHPSTNGTLAVRLCSKTRARTDERIWTQPPVRMQHWHCISISHRPSALLTSASVLCSVDGEVGPAVTFPYPTGTRSLSTLRVAISARVPEEAAHSLRGRLAGAFMLATALDQPFLSAIGTANARICVREGEFDKLWSTVRASQPATLFQSRGAARAPLLFDYGAPAVEAAGGALCFDLSGNERHATLLGTTALRSTNSISVALAAVVPLPSLLLPLFSTVHESSLLVQLCELLARVTALHPLTVKNCVAWAHILSAPDRARLWTPAGLHCLERIVATSSKEVFGALHTHILVRPDLWADAPYPAQQYLIASLTSRSASIRPFVNVGTLIHSLPTTMGMCSRGESKQLRVQWLALVRSLAQEQNVPTLLFCVDPDEGADVLQLLCALVHEQKALAHTLAEMGALSFLSQLVPKKVGVWALKLMGLILLSATQQRNHAMSLLENNLRESNLSTPLYHAYLEVITGVVALSGATNPLTNLPPPPLPLPMLALFAPLISHSSDHTLLPLIFRDLRIVCAASAHRRSLLEALPNWGDILLATLRTSPATVVRSDIISICCMLMAEAMPMPDGVGERSLRRLRAALLLHAPRDTAFHRSLLLGLVTALRLDSPTGKSALIQSAHRDALVWGALGALVGFLEEALVVEHDGVLSVRRDVRGQWSEGTLGRHVLDLTLALLQNPHAHEAECASVRSQLVQSALRLAVYSLHEALRVHARTTLAASSHGVAQLHSIVGSHLAPTAGVQRALHRYIHLRTHPTGGGDTSGEIKRAGQALHTLLGLGLQALALSRIHHAVHHARATLQSEDQLNAQFDSLASQCAHALRQFLPALPTDLSLLSNLRDETVVSALKDWQAKGEQEAVVAWTTAKEELALMAEAQNGARLQAEDATQQRIGRSLAVAESQMKSLASLKDAFVALQHHLHAFATTEQCNAWKALHKALALNTGAPLSRTQPRRIWWRVADLETGDRRRLFLVRSWGSKQHIQRACQPFLTGSSIDEPPMDTGADAQSKEAMLDMVARVEDKEKAVQASEVVAEDMLQLSGGPAVDEMTESSHEDRSPSDTIAPSDQADNRHPQSHAPSPPVPKVEITSPSKGKLPEEKFAQTARELSKGSGRRHVGGEAAEISASFIEAALSSISQDKVHCYTEVTWQTVSRSRAGLLIVAGATLLFFGLDYTTLTLQLADIVRVSPRRHAHVWRAVEIWVRGERSYLFACASVDSQNALIQVLLTKSPADKDCAHAPARQVEALRGRLCDAWRRRDLSNLEYLLALNDIAGRSFHDLGQYPIVPWVLSDYSSATLDLASPSVYRDLSKPIGALEPQRLARYEERYDQLSEEGVPAFHYGTHYSSPASVLYFLLRLEPYTSAAIRFHGKLDHPARQFHSLQHTWHGCLHNASDVKELIPELYYLPSLFKNPNKLMLGQVKESGGFRDIGEVELPPWAGESAERFVQLHRAALESEYVSANLHSWIDLIFGAKQQGNAAVEARNVFYPLTYEGEVGHDPSPAVLTQIESFGQTPPQLFKQSHPPRIALSKLPRTPRTFGETVAALLRPKQSPSDGSQLLPCPPLAVCALAQKKVGVVCTDGRLRVGDWRLHKGAVSFDVSSSYDLHTRSPLPAHAPVAIDSDMCLTGAHWDGALQFYSLTSGRRARDYSHSQGVSALAMDSHEPLALSGSPDGSLALWGLSRWRAAPETSKELPAPAFLYGHSSAICAVALDSVLGVAVSAGVDGRLLTHHIVSKSCLHNYELALVPALIALAPSIGHMIVYASSNNVNELQIRSVGSGDLVAAITPPLEVSALAASSDGFYALVGGAQGSICVYALHASTAESLTLVHEWRCGQRVTGLDSAIADDGSLVVFAATSGGLLTFLLSVGT